MGKPVFSSHLDTGIKGISYEQSKFMWRMKNPLWDLLKFRKGYYKKKFANYMHFDPTVKFSKDFVCNTNYLTVGEFSSLANLYIHDSGPVTIGKHVSFAKNVKIICGTHDLSDFKKTYAFNVIIEDYAFLGLDSMILYDVTIGRGAYVGARAVVRNNVPPYAIVFGNPAKIVGFRMTPDEIFEYEKSLYPVEQRLSLDLLEKNYKKYFVNRYKEIRDFSRI